MNLRLEQRVNYIQESSFDQKMTDYMVADEDEDEDRLHGGRPWSAICTSV